MKWTSVLLAVTAMVLFGAVALASEGKPQTTCPVSGKPIDRATSPHVDWQGQRIFFCCNACPAKLKADPEGFFAKAAEAGVVFDNVQTTCPVSGEKLDETMAKKMASDVAADARTWATQRGRNVELADEAVRESRSFTEQEAIRATPKLPRSPPPAADGSGRTQFTALPSLAKMKTMTQTAARAPNLITVRRFWRLAPQRTPT